MTVANLGTMIIKAGVNEVDIGKVRLQQPVKVSLDAYPKVRFDGTIRRIAPAARLEEKVKLFDVEITVDRQGAELRTAERSVRIPALPVTAIDTVGAGDTLNGALAASLAAGYPLEEAARRAVAAASLAVTKAGAREGMPRRGELEAAVGPTP